ncbi:hypothetical protein DSO57_1025282 [Entomophthora muscae]|uniref:Uncharacterized protein n=2 Tax=Entomophthora muscae TaxID=34485 RepID=A0ACC2RVI4_9FUNG|nr:hypothetical protein DSO57_1018481 [Entomophthora muscae]KAJ9084370.1 hypothetical protein DSO57_1025282 [Entomophthora muscae]
MTSLWVNCHINTPAELPLGQYYDTLVSVGTPLKTAMVYVGTVALWSAINRKSTAKPSPSGPGLKAFVVLHNALLMVFSFLSFYHSAWVLSRIVADEGSFTEKYCDVKGTYWSSGFFYWGWLFYLSKYYEMIDTAIILVKGRIPSLLQTYHHAGAIIGMWFFVSTNSPGLWIFLNLNSFIHTIMYSYYIFTTLGYNPPGKKYITYMQIAQFFVGSFFAASYLAIPGCTSAMQGYSLIFNLSYVAPLIYLFYQFAQESYNKKKTA